jgi:ribosomal protein S12 methylthiotransferase accessory factor YcaO
LAALVGRSLLAGLMGPVPVVMAGVLAEDRPQVPFVVNEHPVGAFGSCGAHPPLGIAVRAGSAAGS